MLHFPGMEYIGMFLILLGIFMRWKVGQRRFKRRTITGVEWFPSSSFTMVILTRTLESLAVILGKVLILVGILIFLAASL